MHFVTRTIKDEGSGGESGLSERLSFPLRERGLERDQAGKRWPDLTGFPRFETRFHENRETCRSLNS